MSSGAFNWDQFRQMPIVGILRGFTAVEAAAAVKAAHAGGLVNFEVTMNSEGAGDQIRQLSAMLEGQGNIGAGTVCSLRDLKPALSAGATFIVTPVVVKEVIRACFSENVPVVPGAMSPSEIAKAFELGASLVKVFPSEILGAQYLRALLGPFPDWRLMPTGGVTIDSLRAYHQSGAAAFGVGSPLFNRQQIAAANWKWVKDQAEGFSKSYRVCARPS